MIKEAYFRGLIKRADATDFFTSYDDRWSRAGLAGLATLLGSKAMGAGWGTSAALAALAGGGAYNTHNIASAVDKVKAMFGSDNKQTAPADQFESQMAESAQSQQDMAQQLRRQELKDEYKQYISAGVPEQRIFEVLDDNNLTPQQKQRFLYGLKRQAQFFAPLRAKLQQARKPQPVARQATERIWNAETVRQAGARIDQAHAKGQLPDLKDVQTVLGRPLTAAPAIPKPKSPANATWDLINSVTKGPKQIQVRPKNWAQMRSAR